MRLPRGGVLLASFLAVAASPVVVAEEALTIATWGGAYQEVQRRVLFQPFTEQTGIEIDTRHYTGGLAILKPNPPDLVDMSMTEALAACRKGDLLRLDYSELPPGADGTPAGRDFIEGAMHPCALAHSIYATVIAYDSRAFPGRRPSRVGDLFDLERFPGDRALQSSPYANLEWALMSYGVPRRELYDLLSTTRGLNLAIERLDSLSGHLQWWRDGQTPVTLLESGKVSMASGYNGRFFAARFKGDSPIEIIWDGQVQERQAWVIPENAENINAAQRFIRFATTTERMTAIAESIAYGPTRQSASMRIGRNPETGIDMRPHIPTHPYNADRAIRKDVQWYARTYDRIRQRFERWRERLRDRED